MKECLIDIVELCPDKKLTVEKIFRRTLAKRINISSNLCDQLKLKLESCNIIDTSQFLIFIRGINYRFEITELLL